MVGLTEKEISSTETEFLIIIAEKEIIALFGEGAF